VAPLEPWEKVLVDYETFSETVHGQVSCMECHRGEQSTNKAEAHKNLVSRPSEDPNTVCGECHPDVVIHAPNNLHVSLKGYWTALDQRSSSKKHPALVEMYSNHCESCHTSCGDCHISQPASVGGGFIEGHIFNKTPSMTRNCTACHGSRVGNEYMGKHEDIKADVHFRQGRMNCVDCHNNHEMHGYPSDCQSCHPGPENSAAPPPDHRYAGIQSPRCESCHIPSTLNNDGILMHQQHGGELSCQVCHSVSYKSCDGCHVAVSEISGKPFFSTEGSYLGFYIGRNVYKSYDRPYEFVTVRHIPVDNNSFQYYGDNLLSGFDNRPTWAYTTPHNIQRNTPQTESCDSCHGNEEIFLTLDKVYPEEVEANLDVLVTEIPPSIFELLQTGSDEITATNVITP
jgi:thiosulfate/3-mercaptopyruvate sulfurtransferase